MKKLSISILALSFLISGCFNNSPETTELNDTAKIIIKVDVPDKDQLMDLSKFIADTINFIPLESSEESLLSRPTKFLINKDKCYILDIAGRTINIFDMNSGRFLTKIKAKIKDDIRDFSVKGDTLVTLNYLKISKYATSNYTFLSQKKFEDEQLKIVNPANFVYQSDNSFYVWNNVDGESTNEDHFIKKYLNGSNKSNYLPHKLGFKSFEINKFSTSFSRESYFSPAINIFDIYKIENDSLSIFASIKLKDQITDKYLESIKGSKNFLNTAIQNEYFKGLGNIIKLNTDLFYFECIGPGSYNYSGIFSTKDKKILDFGKKDFANSPTPFYSDGKFLYAFYEPSHILRMLSGQKSDNFFYKQLVTSKLSTKDGNNVVVVKLKLNEKI